jgi:TolB-like protein
VPARVRGKYASGRTLLGVVVTLLALAVGLLLAQRLVQYPAPGSESGAAQEQAQARPSRPGPALTGSGRKTVAVLPFPAISNGPDDDYFADGLTEEIIHALARLPQLRVTARGSAFQFRERDLPVFDIARQLGVDHVVEGSVHRAGSQLRITARLVRAGDGSSLWSNDYDRRSGDTLEVRDDIARRVAEALGVAPDEQLRVRMARAGVGDAEAFVEFQKGFELLERAQRSAMPVSLLRRGNRHFARAVAIDPAVPGAYLAMNELHTHVLLRRGDGVLDGDITAADVERAPVELERNLGLAIRHAHSEGRRLAAAFDRALTLGRWTGLATLAERVLAARGCDTAAWIQLASAPFDKAEALHRAYSRIAACDPLHPRSWVNGMQARLWQGDFAGALADGGRARDTAAGAGTGDMRSFAMTLALNGRPEDARRAIRTSPQAENRRLVSRFSLAALEGDAEAAASVQQDYLHAFGPDDGWSLVMEAQRGNRNEANRLARIMDARPFGHVSLLQSVFRCYCGAPFDLEAAPDFAARMAGSGLRWPPASPINFPLKHW